MRIETYTETYYEQEVREETNPDGTTRTFVVKVAKERTVTRQVPDDTIETVVDRALLQAETLYGIDADTFPPALVAAITNEVVSVIDNRPDLLAGPNANLDRHLAAALSQRFIADASPVLGLVGPGPGKFIVDENALQDDFTLDSDAFTDEPTLEEVERRLQGTPLQGHAATLIDQLNAAGVPVSVALDRVEANTFGTSPYVVQPGDTLGGIAAGNHVSLDALAAANPQIVDINRINVGDVVHVPFPPPPVIVAPGDSLASIADAEGVALADLIAANPQLSDPNLIFPGATVRLPSAPATYNPFGMTDAQGNLQSFANYDDAIRAFAQALSGRFSTVDGAVFDRSADSVPTDDSAVLFDPPTADIQIDDASSPSVQTPTTLNDIVIDPSVDPVGYARWFTAVQFHGGIVDGIEVVPPDELFDVEVDELATTIGAGNPLLESSLANIYGGYDQIAGIERAPLWEAMGITRDELAVTLATAPWEVASFHLGRELSPQDYEQLTALQGPLGGLLDQGVDPATAMTIQQMWSASFFGGHDPVSGEALEPVWERWHLGSPETLLDLFATDPEAAAALSVLLGGTNPITAESAEAPWGDQTPSIWADGQVAQARSLLGLPEPDSIEDRWSTFEALGEGFEVFALSFTTPSISSQLDYLNPISLAQSPHFRNGFPFQEVGPTQGRLLSSLVDPTTGGVGLFGFFKTSAASGLNEMFNQKNGAFQAHGMVLIDTGDTGTGTVFLGKVQHIPVLDEDQLKALKDNDQALPPSWFIKAQGTIFGQDNSVLIFVGQGDETDGSRGRNPAVLGGTWSYDEDGEIEALGGWFGLPIAIVPGAQKYVPWSGIAFNGELRRNDDGDLVLGGLGTLVEFGTQRYQFMPTVQWDPDTGVLEGGSLMWGTGYTLAQAGFTNDVDNPTYRVHPNGDLTNPVTRDFGPFVAYSNPTTTGFTFATLGGAKGKSAGFGFQSTSFGETTVYVAADPLNQREALAQAQAFERNLLSGDMTVTDLPVGTGFAAQIDEQWSAYGLGFIGFVNIGAGGGHADGTYLQAARPDENTLVISRLEEPRNSGFFTVGAFGVGPTVSGWSANLTGETFTLTGEPTPEVRAALDDYMLMGILPGAKQVNPEAYAEYEALKDVLEAHIGFAPQPHADNMLLDFQHIVNELNASVLGTYGPGDEVLPGLELTSVQNRDTQAMSVGFVATLASTVESKSYLHTEDTTTVSFSLQKGALFHAPPDTDAASMYPHDESIPNAYIISSESDRLFFPASVLDEIPHNVYGPALEMAAADRRLKLGGQLQMALSDDQLLKLGTQIQSDIDWDDFSQRIEGFFDGPFFAANPERTEYSFDLLNDTIILERMAFDVIQEHDLDEDAIARMRNVSSIEAFGELSSAEQIAYAEAIMRTTDPEHSPYQALGLLSEMDSAARAEVFVRAVDLVDDAPLNPYATDPTVELLRVITGLPAGPLRQELVQSTRFVWSPPADATRYLNRDMEELARLAQDAYDLTRGIWPIEWSANNIDADKMTGVLAAVAGQQGPAGVWAFIDEQNIDIDLVFDRFNPSNPNDLLMQTVLIDVLLAGAAFSPAGQPRLEALLAYRNANQAAIADIIAGG